ncbi:hypothetical protein DFH09DRAFT_1191741 [Mycena vulgaris]|nr:hypothetical protein DFH09DRAFT_1191741 [Mycena vulgaris]
MRNAHAERGGCKASARWCPGLQTLRTAAQWRTAGPVCSTTGCPRGCQLSTPRVVERCASRERAGEDAMGAHLCGVAFGSASCVWGEVRGDARGVGGARRKRSAPSSAVAWQGLEACSAGMLRRGPGWPAHAMAAETCSDVRGRKFLGETTPSAEFGDCQQGASAGLQNSLLIIRS